MGQGKCLLISSAPCDICCDHVDCNEIIKRAACPTGCLAAAWHQEFKLDRTHQHRPAGRGAVEGCEDDATCSSWTPTAGALLLLTGPAAWSMGMYVGGML